MDRFGTSLSFQTELGSISTERGHQKTASFYQSHTYRELWIWLKKKKPNMPVIGDDTAIVFTFLSSLKPFEGIILNRDFHVPVRDQQVKIILMGFCQSWWYILVLEMFTNIVQITNIFFKINYFAFSQVSISKSYNSKISLTHLQSLYFWKTQYSTICFQTSSYLFHWPQSDGESFSLPGWHHLWPRTRKVKHSHKTFSWFEGNWK